VSFTPPATASTPGAARDATIVVEQSLADPQQTPGPADTVIVPTSIVPVSVRAPIPSRVTPPADGNYAFTVASPSGGVLVNAEVARQDLNGARSAVRDRVWAVAL